MILTDIELSNLKKNLEKLKVVYQTTDEKKYSSDIKFIRTIISKIDNELVSCNKVIYNKIGNNKFISKIYAGGHLCYYYDKFHNLITDISLKNHIGDIFECQIIDNFNNSTEESQKQLLDVKLNEDGEIISVEFD